MARCPRAGATPTLLPSPFSNSSLPGRTLLGCLALALAPAARASSTYATPYTFTTIAGLAGLNGIANGQGTIALFNQPAGIAVDLNGNLYVGDYGNSTIRKITATGLVTTFAGSPGQFGSGDGTGAAAQFGNVNGIAVDHSGNVYVADSYYNTIRKITPAGAVTTLAGTPGVVGYKDGTGASAQFDQPAGVGIDGAGNLYVADTGNYTVRKVTQGGVVTTLAGKVLSQGLAEGTGSSAQFFQPTGVVSDASGNLFVSDANAIRRVTSSGVVSTLAGTILAAGYTDGNGTAAEFYEPDGMALDAFGNLYVADTFNDTIRMVTPAGVVTTLAGRVESPGSADGTGSAALFQGPLGIAVDASGVLYVADTYNDLIRKGSAAPPNTSPPRLVNISTRAQVGTGGNILIPGFVIAGTGMETLLIRADGPSLTQFSVANALAQPVLLVFDSTQTVIASNTGWGNSANPQLLATTATAVGAFALPPGSADCALIATLPPGAYTVQVSGVGGTTGVALAEIYEVSSTGTRLSNISTRAQVGTGNGFLIPGFVITGSGTEHLLLRGDGPSLSQFDVPGVLAQPSLVVQDNNLNIVTTNTGWSTNTNAADIAAAASGVGAFALSPGSADSATIATLSPGVYTMQISGVNGTTGVALAEVYELP